MFFLPDYSPELNPDELLNSNVKANAVGRQHAQTPPELEHNTQILAKYSTSAPYSP